MEQTFPGLIGKVSGQYVNFHMLQYTHMKPEVSPPESQREENQENTQEAELSIADLWNEALVFMEANMASDPEPPTKEELIEYLEIFCQHEITTSDCTPQEAVAIVVAWQRRIYFEEHPTLEDRQKLERTLKRIHSKIAVESLPLPRTAYDQKKEWDALAFARKQINQETENTPFNPYLKKEPITDEPVMNWLNYGKE